MAEKVILKVNEYGQLPQKVKDIHSELITIYGNILDAMEAAVAWDGPISTMEFSPKISSFTKDVRANIKSKLADIFDTTDQAIDDYIVAISNIDAI